MMSGERSMTLAEGLPAEINRVREVQDTFKQLRGIKNVIVEPQIAMMEVDIQAGIAAGSSGDVVAMLRAYEALKDWDA